MKNFFDYRVQNKDIQEAIASSIENIFPIESSTRILEVQNIKIDDNLSDTDFPQQREVKLQRQS